MHSKNAWPGFDRREISFAWVGSLVLFAASVILFLLLPAHLIAKNVTYAIMVVLNGTGALLSCAAWFACGRPSGSAAELLVLCGLELSLALAEITWLASMGRGNVAIQLLIVSPGWVLMLIGVRRVQNPRR